MRKASKTPSEWLRLLCKDWAAENSILVDATDVKFQEYKPFLKGLLTSQLLCRLSMPTSKESFDGTLSQSGVDFWGILGIKDEFDKNYVIAQVERFCLLYNVRGAQVECDDSLLSAELSTADPTALAAAAAAGISANVSPIGAMAPLTAYVDHGAAAAAAAAAAASFDLSRLSKRQISEVSRAQRIARDAEKALEIERRLNSKREHKRAISERREQKAREREITAIRKATERATRELAREERRKRKLEIRDQRERFAQDQKDAALKRAAELVSSNRVPIEITRGATAAKVAAANSQPIMQPAVTPSPQQHMFMTSKKSRSAIVVSTASDLHQIVTHSKNLWEKYNAIAKEHNQKVNWITVSKELGIHVKVREKYARMHFRAEQRGFDWVKYGYWKIKDHPEIFVEPTQAEQKAKMPLPPPSENHTVLVNGTKEVTDEAVAAAAAVVDASVNTPPVDAVVQTTAEQTAAAAAVAATWVADPTAALSHDDPNSDSCVPTMMNASV
jgi:hypothetical protein